jgi:hypothetical protein
MLATAIALQNATQEAVHDPMVMDFAADVFQSRYLPDEEFAQKLYQYSALLASLTTTLATNALLTESQMDEMISSIKEMDALTKEIENGN